MDTVTIECEELESFGIEMEKDDKLGEMREVIAELEREKLLVDSEGKELTAKREGVDVDTVEYESELKTLARVMDENKPMDYLTDEGQLR